MTRRCAPATNIIFPPKNNIQLNSFKLHFCPSSISSSSPAIVGSSFLVYYTLICLSLAACRIGGIAQACGAMAKIRQNWCLFLTLDNTLSNTMAFAQAIKQKKMSWDKFNESIITWHFGQMHLYRLDRLILLGLVAAIDLGQKSYFLPVSRRFSVAPTHPIARLNAFAPPTYTTQYHKRSTQLIDIFMQYTEFSRFRAIT